MIQKNSFYLCVPVAAVNREALQVQLNSINKDEIDYIEWRRDYLPVDDVETEDTVARSLRAFGIPVIYTHRLNMKMVDENSKRLWQESMLRGAVYDFVEYTDVDLSCVEPYFEITSQNQNRNHCGLILSVHNDESCYDLETLLNLTVKMSASGADVIKIAHTPRSFSETRDVIENVKILKKTTDVPIIHVLMGDYGMCSRVFPELCGGSLTYAKGIAATAKGQLPIAEIKKWRKNKKMIDCLPELC